jgi:hypothetical protein
MRSSPASGRRPFRVAATLGLLAALGGTGCDNSACVFSTGVCTSTGTPAGALGGAATRPALGAWISPTAPTLDRTVPSGAGQDQRTPIVLEFSESISAETVVGAFQLRTFDTGTGSIPLATTPILVGDGRLLVLVPSAAIPLGAQMEVVVTASAEVRDLTGQEVDLDPGEVITSFGIANAQIAVPKIVATFPRDGAFDESEIGEIVVVFDRQMDQGTIDDDSWVVEVDGGPPPVDPAPTPGTGLAIFGVPTPEPRIWRWRAVNAAGLPVALGREVEVTLDLSPAGQAILDTLGGALATTQISYRTASVLAPGELRITSDPSEAIGIAALTPQSGAELMLEVDVDSATDGDRLDLYFFGPNPDESGDLLALRRSFDFNGAGPFAIAELIRADLDLAVTTSPLVARFADGQISIAASFTSGPITTPVVLIDVDADTSGVQGPLLDTVAPTIATLDRTATGTATYRTAAGDVVFEGLANEELAGLRVVTILGSTPADAVAFANGNRFASEPIDIGVVPVGQAPLEYSLVPIDRAGNVGSAVIGDLFQGGYTSDTPLAPAGAGDPITVEVLDGPTLAPLTGALVFTHADPGMGGTPLLVTSDITGSDGLAEVTSHTAADAGVIVTIARPGYDLVSFHHFTSSRLSVALQPIGGLDAQVRGTLTSSSAQVQFSLSSGDLLYVDGRRPEGLAAPFTGSTCTTSPFGGGGISCPYGPRDVLGARSGSVAAANGVFDLPENSFTALLFLSTFAFAHPVGPIGDGVVQTVPLVMQRLLSDPDVPPGQGAIDFGVLSFDTNSATGLDTLMLADDPLVAGPVRVWVEGDFGGGAPGVPAGLGASYDQGGGVFTLRGALAGEVSARSALAFDPTQRMSVGAEAVDANGARSGVRRTLAGLVLGGTNLVAPPVPTLLSPPAGSNLGTGAFTIEVENALVDGALGGTDGSGLVHLRLVDASGRGWDHYRPDVLDTDGAVVFFAPDLAGAGAVPLANGALAASARALGWTGFDSRGLFLSDLATRPELFSQSPTVVHSIP